MIKQLNALKSALAGVCAGGVFLVENDTPANTFPTLPYLLIEPGIGDPVFEPSAAGSESELVLNVRLKAVGATPESVLFVLGNARQWLVAGKRFGRLAVADWSTDIEFKRNEATYSDTQTLLTQTVRQVHLSVDSYLINSRTS